MFEIFHYENIFLNHPSTKIFLIGITKARKIKHLTQRLFPIRSHELWNKEVLVFMREIPKGCLTFISEYPCKDSCLFVLNSRQGYPTLDLIQAYDPQSIKASSA